MKISALGSGSAGNSIVFGDDEVGYWLVDVGLSAKQLVLRLHEIGVMLDQINGIFISHEHKDHIGGLPVFLKKCPVKVYVSTMTHEYLCSQLNISADWHIFEPGQPFQLESGVEVEALRIPHDATDPVGFLFSHESCKVGILSDLGYVSESLSRRFLGVELLYVEANYDIKLLEQDTKRPWSIKQRISSRHGHLSNEQALDLISELQKHGLKKVLLGHLSRDCNTPACLMELLRGLPSGIEYEISTQDTPTSWMELLQETKVTPSHHWNQLTLF